MIVSAGLVEEANVDRLLLLQTVSTVAGSVVEVLFVAVPDAGSGNVLSRRLL